jgi:aerobic-type carbon monoxide dehydrogenase small subunit (CoxS/CutS family)
VTRLIATSINGRDREVAVAANHTLLEVLRDELGLRGAVEGCGVGVCGSCTVLVDDRPVSSCLMLATNAEARRITTIEGLSPDGALSPVQQAFLDHQAFQCGFCTPGMIMAVEGLLREHDDPSEADTRDYLSGNLCRCGTYSAVIEAVRAVVAQLRSVAAASGAEPPS